MRYQMNGETETAADNADFNACPLISGLEIAPVSRSYSRRRTNYLHADFERRKAISRLSEKRRFRK